MTITGMIYPLIIGSPFNNLFIHRFTLFISLSTDPSIPFAFYFPLSLAPFSSVLSCRSFSLILPLFLPCPLSIHLPFSLSPLLPSFSQSTLSLSLFQVNESQQQLGLNSKSSLVFSISNFSVTLISPFFFLYDGLLTSIC